MDKNCREHETHANFHDAYIPFAIHRSSLFSHVQFSSALLSIVCALPFEHHLKTNAHTSVCSCAIVWCQSEMPSHTRNEKGLSSDKGIASDRGNPVLAQSRITLDASKLQWLVYFYSDFALKIMEWVVCSSTPQTIRIACNAHRRTYLPDLTERIHSMLTFLGPKMCLMFSIVSPRHDNGSTHFL